MMGYDRLKVRGGRRWFAVESKSFDISVEEEGGRIKGIITERRKGIKSWIRFGEQSLSWLLQSVEECCRGDYPGTFSRRWEENGRRYTLIKRRNGAGNFLQCSVMDADSKRFSVVFPEGRNLKSGWAVLADKLRDLGVNRSKNSSSHSGSDVEAQRIPEISPVDGKKMLSFAEVVKHSRRNQGESVSIQIGELETRSEEELALCCLVGWCDSEPTIALGAGALRRWAVKEWDIKGSLRIEKLMGGCIMFVFDDSVEVNRVLRRGNRWFQGRLLSLSRWGPEVGMRRLGERTEEYWVRVVGLPLHCWKEEIFCKIGNACGGFIKVDEISSQYKFLQWTRLLVRTKEGGILPSSLQLRVGPQVFICQLWWEVPAIVSKVPSPSWNGELGFRRTQEDEEVKARERWRVEPEKGSTNSNKHACLHKSLKTASDEQHVSQLKSLKKAEELFKNSAKKRNKQELLPVFGELRCGRVENNTLTKPIGEAMESFAGPNVDMLESYCVRPNKEGSGPVGLDKEAQVIREDGPGESNKQMGQALVETYKPTLGTAHMSLGLEFGPLFSGFKGLRTWPCKNTRSSFSFPSQGKSKERSLGFVRNLASAGSCNKSSKEGKPKGGAADLEANEVETPRYFPEGIDIFFDNVGGDMLDAALTNMRIHGRIAMCGMVSQTSLSNPQLIHNMHNMITKRITMKGFLQSDYLHLFPRFVEDVSSYYKQRKIVYIEDMNQGLETAPAAFVGLFSGKNVGKQVICVAPE